MSSPSSGVCGKEHQAADQDSNYPPARGLNPMAVGFQPDTDRARQKSGLTTDMAVPKETEALVQSLLERMAQLEIVTSNELSNMRYMIGSLKTDHPVLTGASYQGPCTAAEIKENIDQPDIIIVANAQDKNLPNPLMTDSPPTKLGKAANEAVDAMASGARYQESASPEIVVDPEHALPTVEDPALTSTKSQPQWQPLAIRRLGQVAEEDRSRIPSLAKMQSFGAAFIHEILRGTEWSHGFYYAPRGSSEPYLPSHTYYLLDGRAEPYLPSEPGTHGAKLTAFFNSNVSEDMGDEDDTAYIKVPLFISVERYMKGNPLHANNGSDGLSGRYIYFGTYSQHRWSDKLDYDRMVEHVPCDVKMFWAEKLTLVDRPEWVTKALMEHFWPKPEYDGPFPNNTLSTRPSGVVGILNAKGKGLEAMEEYTQQLRGWEHEARMKAGFLKKEDILGAFENEDAGNPPGLRLWWEYLECEGWDEDFYKMLVKKQENYDKAL